MTKKALGRGLDALISGGVMTPVSIQPPQPANTATAAVSVPHAVAPLASIPSVMIEPRMPRVEQAAQPASPIPVQGVHYLSLDQIQPNRLQPRSDFDPEPLRELADSIKQQGVIQPLLVRPLSGSAASGLPSLARYELIAGERRWRAAREAGLTTIPAIVRTATDREALEMALIENLQREDLDPIEEARAYLQLTTQFSLTQDQVAEKVGRSRAAVANAMRLLGLPDEVQSWVADNRLSVGHAKAILGLTLIEEQRLVAERVLTRNLTVRETEQLVEQLKGTGKATVRALGRQAIKSPHIQAIEEQLRQKLGTHVAIQHGRKKGRIEIEYYGNDDLSRLLGLLGLSES